TNKRGWAQQGVRPRSFGRRARDDRADGEPGKENDVKQLRSRRVIKGVATLLAMLILTAPALPARAASHRESPRIALNPAADNTDVYAFRSWEDPTKAVFIMNVIPSQVPGSGPNYFNFDDDVLYAFHLDLNADGAADDADIEFSFTSEVRAPFTDLPVS